MKLKLRVFIYSVLLSKRIFQTTDIILTNAKIFTSNEKQLFVQAFAIKGNKIVAVGNKEQIQKLSQ